MYKNNNTIAERSQILLHVRCDLKAECTLFVMMDKKQRSVSCEQVSWNRTCARYANRNKTLSEHTSPFTKLLQWKVTITMKKWSSIWKTATSTWCSEVNTLRTFEMVAKSHLNHLFITKLYSQPQGNLRTKAVTQHLQLRVIASMHKNKEKS